MKITIVTLFPEVFTYLDASIIKRAQENSVLSIGFINPRDYTTDKHRTVDDIPYGGGPGMVLKPEPFFAAIANAREKLDNKGRLIITSPQGERLDQDMVKMLAKEEELILLCGHYEGFDERIHSAADMEISIGDYVLTGGELPVMVIVDAVTRLLPGAIDQQSAESESFQRGLLDHPHYTRPQVYEGMKVPDVLLSGHHENIRLWRKRESLLRTFVHRPDLLERANLDEEEQRLLTETIHEFIKIQEAEEAKKRF